MVTDVNTVRQSYPQCAQAGANNVTDVFVAVHASVNGSHLTSSSAVRLTFGMSIWIAMVSHIIAVEIYVRIILHLPFHKFNAFIFGFLDPKDGVVESSQAWICAGAR